MYALLRTGAGALLAISIMILGSLGLWLGTPLLWLWVGSQIQGSTASLALALLVMALGVLVTVWVAARVLAALSDGYRAIRVPQGCADPGHEMLETVLVVTAGVALVAFGVWFLLFAGADPIPIGISL